MNYFSLVVSNSITRKICISLEPRNLLSKLAIITNIQLSTTKNKIPSFFFKTSIFVYNDLAKNFEYFRIYTFKEKNQLTRTFEEALGGYQVPAISGTLQ